MKKTIFILMILTIIISCNDKKSVIYPDNASTFEITTEEDIDSININSNSIESTLNSEEALKENSNLDVSVNKEQDDEEALSNTNKAETEVLNSSDYSKFHDNALTLLLDNNLERALTEINKALEIRPKESSSHYVRGNINQKLGYLNDALKDFKTTIQLNPNNTDALMKCAIIYGNQNNKDMTCFYLSKACNLGASDACSGFYKFCN